MQKPPISFNPPPPPLLSKRVQSHKSYRKINNFFLSLFWYLSYYPYTSKDSVSLYAKITIWCFRLRNITLRKYNSCSFRPNTYHRKNFHHTLHKTKDFFCIVLTFYVTIYGIYNVCLGVRSDITFYLVTHSPLCL